MDIMNLTSYIEVNIICIIISAIIYVRLWRNTSNNAMANIILRRMIVMVWLLCLADIVAIICHGKFFTGDRIVIHASNLLYFIMIPAISFIWLFYVSNLVNKKWKKWQIWLIAIPFILFIALAASNPFTRILFKIDEANNYTRGDGVFLHWIVSWFYVIWAGIMTVIAVRKETNWVLRTRLLSSFFFLIISAVSAAIQMFIYGVTTIQVGITISILLISLQTQDTQITVDELTGINNRAALRRYLENVIHRNAPPKLTVFMLDINRFKSINDTLGHAVGDVALCYTAKILSDICGRQKEPLFLCRYGGDEFVIIGRNMDKYAIGQIKRSIREDVKQFNEQEERPYKLEISIGHSQGECATYEQFARRLRAADDEMYDDKLGLLKTEGN